MRHIYRYFSSLVIATAMMACAPQVQKTSDVPASILPPATMYDGGKAHFNQRLPEIGAQPRLDGGILLAGDSITEAWLWHEAYLPLPSSNHGIGWDTAEGLNSRLPQILRHNPDYLFILIGTNDIGYGHSAEHVAGYVRDMIETLQDAKPEARLYLQALLPRESKSLEQVSNYNAALKKVAEAANIKFLDMTADFAAPDGTLIADYTEDGLHLNEAGYAVWGRILSSVVKASPKQD